MNTQNANLGTKNALGQTDMQCSLSRYKV